MATDAHKKSDDSSSPVNLNVLPDEQTRRFVKDLIARHDYHTGLAKDLNRRYKFMSPILLIFIPTYSAILSFLTTGVVSEGTLGWCALVLTVATILNSIVRPDEKFISSANVLVQLKDWEADLVLSLSVIHQNDREEVVNFLRKKSGDLSEIGSSMAKTYLPLKNN